MPMSPSSPVARHARPKATCRDTHSDCPGWTADGECYQNPGFMYKTCPLSCGVCEGSMCADGNSTQCEIWKESGECLANPLAVMKECPTACGARQPPPASLEKRPQPDERVPARERPAGGRGADPLMRPLGRRAALIP